MYIFNDYSDKSFNPYDFLIDPIRRGESEWLFLPSQSQIYAIYITKTDIHKKKHIRLIDLALDGSSWPEFEKIVLYFNNLAKKKVILTWVIIRMFLRKCSKEKDVI